MCCIVVMNYTVSDCNGEPLMSRRTEKRVSQMSLSTRLRPVTVSSGMQESPADLDGSVKRAFARLKLVDAVKMAVDGTGNARTMNMVIAGALSAFCPFDVEFWLKSMENLLSGPKAKLLDINKKAFALGRAAVAND